MTRRLTQPTSRNISSERKETAKVRALSQSELKMLSSIQAHSLSSRDKAPITLARVGNIESRWYRTVPLKVEPWNRPTAFKIKKRRRLCL